MIKYFINVILGVLIKPKRAMEYALNDSSALHLTLLILFGGWFGTYSTIFNGTLFISNYVNDLVMDGLFFALVFLFFSIFSKIFKMKVTSKDIFYVTLLTGVVSMWMSCILICLVFFPSIILNHVGIPHEYIGFVLLIIGITVMFLGVVYTLYISIQMFNAVDKKNEKKSILLVILTSIVLGSISLISKYSEDYQRDFAISIYKNFIKNSNNTEKLKYYENIADLYEEQNQYEEAIKYYLKAVKIEEDNMSKSSDYYWIAEDYRKLGNIDLALQYAKKSLSLTPEDKDSLEQVRDIEEQKLEIQ